MAVVRARRTFFRGSVMKYKWRAIAVIVVSMVALAWLIAKGWMNSHH
jgi:hypothetical protein